jgi:hypothetical protein
MTPLRTERLSEIEGLPDDSSHVIDEDVKDLHMDAPARGHKYVSFYDIGSRSPLS